MTPREIDTLVAEKVLGIPPYLLHNDPKGRMIEGLHVAECPHYSTDIADAWQVVEQMEQAGWHWRLDTPFDDGDTYGAGLTPKGMSGWNGRSDVMANASTMSKAICLAALQAIGIDLNSPETSETTQ